MSLKRVGMQADPEIWDKLLGKAKEINHSRNKMLNRVFEAVVRMDNDELIKLMYPTEPHLSTPGAPETP